MDLKDEILVWIAESSVVMTDEVEMNFPEVSKHQISEILFELLKDGFIKASATVEATWSADYYLRDTHGIDNITLKLKDFE